jgi:hypothetical protein
MNIQKPNYQSTGSSNKIIPIPETIPLTNSSDVEKPFYSNTNSEVEIIKLIHENDINDLKRSIAIRYVMFILSIICNLICSLSLSANIIINIIQNMSNKENLFVYQIISLSIFGFSLGLNYFSNTIDTNLKNQQKNLLIKFGLDSKYYNDQDAINFDQSSANQILKNKYSANK